jgi:hypothetical protein
MTNVLTVKPVPDLNLKLSHGNATKIHLWGIT